MQDLITTIFHAAIDTIVDFIDLDNPLFVNSCMALIILSPGIAIFAGIILN